MNLITGATGLVGSNLARLLLSKGEKVRAIKRVMSETSLLNDINDQIEWIEGDVLHIPSLEEAMEGTTNVYHCAAMISFIPGEIDRMMKINTEGVANVMNVALASNIRKVVHVSSIAAFGIPPAGKVVDEKFSDPNINKAFWYYRSKHYGEREAWRAYEEGLNVVIACPSTIIGAGWWDAEPNSLFPEIYNGLKFYTTCTNGFIDVRDVTECLHRLMQSDISGEKFILSAENLSFRDVMFQMADEMKVKRPSLEAGKFLRSVAWRMEAIKSLFTNHRPLITRESAELAGISFSYNNEKIKQALNFNFRPLKQTIADTAQVFLKTHGEGKEYGVFQDL